MTALLEWRTSQHCGASNTCVEVAPTERAVHVRDSTDPDGPRLTLAPAAWAGLVKAIKEGR